MPTDRQTGQRKFRRFVVQPPKLVNDEFGHEAGDYVLREVARRLVQVVRTTDTVARIGGDEFLVILSVIPEAPVAAEIARKVIAMVSEPVLFKHMPLVVGCNIGISLYPDHADNSLNLQRAADIAMYGVKRADKNNFAFSDSGKTEKLNNSSQEERVVPV